MAKKGFGDLTSSLMTNSAKNFQSIDGSEVSETKRAPRPHVAENPTMDNIELNANIAITTSLRRRRESKSKRFNLLMRPSTFESLAKIAWVEESSINDLINHVLEDFAKGKKETIEIYDKEFSH